MNYYLASELGCVYRLNDGILEYAPLRKDSIIPDEDFGPVEPELVGEELVTFNGAETDLYTVFATVTEALTVPTCREVLEAKALESVCPCYFYELRNDIQDLDDDFLNLIVADGMTGHYENQKHEPVPDDEYLEELRSCPSYVEMVA